MISNREDGTYATGVTQNDFLDFYERISSVLEIGEGWLDDLYKDCPKVSDTVPLRRLVKKLDLQAGIRRTLLR